MSSLNQVQLIGNLGKDPELRYTAGGDPVVSFSIATSETWKDKSTGEKKEKTEWHNCVAWRGLAEVIGEHVAKGHKLFVQGKLQTRKWEDSDGKTRYSTEILVDQMVMLGRPAGGGGGDREAPPQRERGERTARQAGGAPASKPKSGGFDDMDDDIPF